MLGLLAPLLQKQGVDPNVLLAMKGNNGMCGEGGWFMWVIFLFFLMGWGGNGWGGSFDLFYLIPRNQGVLYSTTDVVTTFVTRALFDGDYLRGTSVTLIQSVIGLILIVACNAVVRRISPENAMF